MNYLIIRGPLGIGKTTISEKLAKELNGIHISIDSIVDNPKLIKREKEEGYISRKNFLDANDIALTEAKKHLDNHKIVIFDGNFYYIEVIEDLIAKLKDLGYKGQVFTLKASLNECIKRDSGRKRVYGIDAAKAVYKKVDEFDYGIVIDTTNKTPDEVIKKIKNNLK
ncbi:MAG: AAA family ATPase [Candidatus Nanoarchaeia archaeon]